MADAWYQKNGTEVVAQIGSDLHKGLTEQEAAARFPMQAHGTLYAYCNRHGLFYQKL